MSFREVLMKVTAATAGMALLAVPATGVAQAGKKITKESFAIHSFREKPDVPAGSIRMNVWPSWRQVQPSKGQYRWAPFDANVNLAESWGFKDLLYVFGATPYWAGSDVRLPDRELPPPIFGPRSTSAPAKMKYFKKYATAVVKRYKGRIDGYQVWNEITSPQFYQGTAKQMAKMTKILNKVVNKHDHRATVVSGSVQTHAQAYYDQIAPAYFAALGAKGWPVDVAAGHFYPLGKGGPNKRIKQIKMFERDVDRAGRPKRVKMWDTEANFWTTVPGEPYAGRVKGKKAAIYLARNYLDTWRTGLKRSYWYMWTVGNQDLRFPGVQLRTGDPATMAYKRLGGWTIGSKYKGCKTKGKLVSCTFKKGGKFKIAFTTKGKAKMRVPGTKEMCPVYGGDCTTVKRKVIVTKMPVRIG